MKKIKTILSLIFALCLIIGSNVSVYAAGSDSTVETDIVITSSYNPFESDAETRSIIGSDDRIVVSSTSSYPYSAIAYLTINFSCGCTAAGNGFMASKNCMLTAGHCVVCSERGKDASSITATFGYQSSSNYLIRVTATSSDSVIYHDPNFTGTEKNYDYGYVIFETNVGNTTGWLGLASYSDSTLDGMDVFVAGYQYGTMYRGNGNITSVATNRIKYDADTDATQSGSPVYYSDSTHGNMVVAIHTHDTDLLNWKNSGWRITSDFINELVALGYVTMSN